jgi:hypothetical protein
VKLLASIKLEDFALLESLMKSEIARNLRNPTDYCANLFKRGLEIIAEHISESADPIESNKTYRI